MHSTHAISYIPRVKTKKIHGGWVGIIFLVFNFFLFKVRMSNDSISAFIWFTHNHLVNNYIQYIQYV